jgi:hypothetical protein
VAEAVLLPANIITGIVRTVGQLVDNAANIILSAIPNAAALHRPQQHQGGQTLQNGQPQQQQKQTMQGQQQQLQQQLPNAHLIKVFYAG